MRDQMEKVAVRVITQARSWWRGHHTSVTTVAGFAFLAAAAWTLALTLGLAAIGASLLILDRLAEIPTS